MLICRLAFREVEYDERRHIVMFKPFHELVDAYSGCSSMSALTLPSAAKASAPAISLLVPTNQPRVVMQFAIT